MKDDRAWSDAQRLESWAGELRLNLIRLLAIAAFYAYHLLDAYVLRDDPAVRGDYHTLISVVTFAWAVGALTLQLYLLNRWVPAALMYVATAWDLVMITAVLMIGRDPATLLTVLYVLVVAAAALRLSLPLIYAATLGAMVAFLFFHGYIRYWLELPAGAARAGAANHLSARPGRCGTHRRPGGAAGTAVGPGACRGSRSSRGGLAMPYAVTCPSCHVRLSILEDAGEGFANLPTLSEHGAAPRRRAPWRRHTGARDQRVGAAAASRPIG